jgi:hypothetical protein
MDFEFRAVIDCSPTEVFAFFRDVDRHAGQEGSVVPVYEKVTSGPTGIGTRYREVIRLLPYITAEMHTEVTCYRPERCLAYCFSGLGMDGSLEYEFETAGPGTRVLQRQSLHPRGLLVLLSPLIKLLFSWVAGRRLEEIKDLLESTAGGSGPQPAQRG